MKKIVIIVPAYNEADNLNVLVETIIKDVTCCEIKQILFVNDGSSDNTIAVLRDLKNKYFFVDYISFSKNYGHQLALKAGFDSVVLDSETALVTMDADLQHPPRIINEMIEQWALGYNIVNTIRLPEEKQKKFKKFTSSLYYKIINFLSNVDIKSGTADFRLIDYKVLKVCKNLNECGSFFWRGLIPWVGFKQNYIEYIPDKRRFGESKYSLKKMLKLALNGILTFSLIPLRFATFLGLILIVLSIFYSFYIVIQLISGNAVPGWTSIILVNLFLSSFQILLLGVFGEYLGKIYLGSLKRPLYIIESSSLESESSSEKNIE